MQNLLFFISPPLGLHEGRPRHKSLQLSKETIHHFKSMNFFHFFLFLLVTFVLLDPDPYSHGGSGSADKNQCGSILETTTLLGTVF
jgi:hypothetical protein